MIQFKQIDVVATITINQKEAEVLEYITGYDLTKAFVGSRYTDDQIKNLLRNVRSACALIIDAHKEANDQVSQAVFNYNKRQQGEK